MDNITQFDSTGIDPFVEIPVDNFRIGYRTELFQPVDVWEPKPEDYIFTCTKNFIRLRVGAVYGGEDGNPIDLFYLNTKRCYNNMREHTTKYLNYFEKFYDSDHELWSIYANIKLLMDTQTAVYTKDRFFYDLQRMILNPNCSIFAKVNQMNEENYALHLSYRNNKNPALQYTDYHAKLLMRVSVLMNFIIPLITHYLYVTKITDTQSFILEIFYFILHNLCENVNMINKLYETTTTNVVKNANSNAILWEMQDIRGKSIETHINNCVEDIIVTIIPKYQYNLNIIHFNFKSIMNSNRFKITDISYEFSYIKMSSVKEDGDNNSDFDKFESFIVKDNESKYLIIEANYEKVMLDLETTYLGVADPEEIKFYHQELSRGENYEVDENGDISVVQDDRSCIRELQKNMIFLLFAKYFGCIDCLKEINYVDYIKLIMIAKRMLLKSGMRILPYIISGRFEVSKIKSINIKEKTRMESSQIYQQVKLKYRNSGVMDLALELISRILASKFTIIDYDNEAINGQPVPMYNDIIIEEILMFISKI